MFQNIQVIYINPAMVVCVFRSEQDKGRNKAGMICWDPAVYPQLEF